MCWRVVNHETKKENAMMAVPKRKLDGTIHDQIKWHAVIRRRCYPLPPNTTSTPTPWTNTGSVESSLLVFQLRRLRCWRPKLLCRENYMMNTYPGGRHPRWGGGRVTRTVWPRNGVFRKAPGALVAFPSPFIRVYLCIIVSTEGSTIFLPRRVSGMIHWTKRVHMVPA